MTDINLAADNETVSDDGGGREPGAVTSRTINGRQADSGMAT